MCFTRLSKEKNNTTIQNEVYINPGYQRLTPSHFCRIMIEYLYNTDTTNIAICNKLILDVYILMILRVQENTT